VIHALPAQPAEHKRGQVTAEHRGHGLVEQLSQSVTAYLGRDERLLVVPKSWAIHVNRLIMMLRQKSDCAIRLAKQTNESN
jgi:hypothetical protein